MDIDDDDEEESPSAPTTSNSTSVHIILCCTQLFNRFYIITFDHPFSTSAAIQQVTLFKPPTGGHKWCPGSVISTVRLIAHTAS